MNWRWLWSDKGYAETSLAHTRVDHSVAVTEESPGSTRTLRFGNESTEREIALRSNWHYRPGAGTALVWGMTARRVLGDFEVFNRPALTRANALDEGLDLRETLKTSKLGAFASVDRRLASRLTATAGARFDFFGLNGEKTWSPRLALAYEIDSRTTATAAAGQYRQTLPLWLLVQHPDNRRLGNQRADHYVVGLRRRMDHRVQLRNFNVVSFVSVLNVYNRDNPFQYYWDAGDERTRRVKQWGFIPVGGFELEF